MSAPRVWTPEDLATAQSMRAAGFTYLEIGERLERNPGNVFEKLKKLKVPTRAWRPWTEAEKRQARELRASGLDNKQIGIRLARRGSDVSRKIGPRPPVVKAPDPEGVRRGARGQILLRDPDRTGWTDFALPAGHPTTWDAISAEPWPYRR